MINNKESVKIKENQVNHKKRHTFLSPNKIPSPYEKCIQLNGNLGGNVEKKVSKTDQKSLRKIPRNEQKIVSSQAQLNNYRSHPNLFSNNYIKVQPSQRNTDIDKYLQKIKTEQNCNLTKSSKMIPQQKKRQPRLRPRQTQNFRNERNRQFLASNINQQIADITQKKSPKFTRKSINSNCDNGQTLKPHTLKRKTTSEVFSKSKIMQANAHRDKYLIEKYQKQIKDLKKQIDERDRKIKELQTKIYFTIPDLKEKLQEKQQIIKTLNNQINSSKKDQIDLTKRIEELIAEPELFKASSSQCLDFDDDDYMGTTGSEQIQMTSTAQFIENLSDLEDQLQKKNLQNHRLLKNVDQLKMKLHCQEMKHSDEMKKLVNSWQAKYQNLKDIITCKKSSKTQTTNNIHYCQSKHQNSKDNVQEPEDVRKRQFQKVEFRNKNKQQQKKGIANLLKIGNSNSTSLDKDSIISLSFSLQSSLALQ